MEVNIKMSVTHGSCVGIGGPVVAVPVYTGKLSDSAKDLDRELGGLISRAVDAGDFTGNAGETHVLYPEGSGSKVPARVLLVGAGEAGSKDDETARVFGNGLVNALRSLKVTRAVLAIDGGKSKAQGTSRGRALAEGILMGAYRYEKWLTDGRNKPLRLTTLKILVRNKTAAPGVSAGVTLGSMVAHSVNEARDLVNGPSNEVTPTFLANTAKRLGRQLGFKVKILDEAQCAKLGMGSFLGVAQGATEPAKFIVMEHAPRGAKGTVCLVGKGITFDTGGISLKPGADMDQMKYDMGGAAAVIGAMRYAASSKVPIKVVGIIAATENMPSGDAYKPGDILTSSAGVTIEVLNTDAEGRLVLADALEYAKRYDPDAVIDLATLTGACVIALGGHAAGLMGNDEWLLDEVWEASFEAGERAWPLPLWSEYRKMVQSNIADIKNTAGRGAGAITAGAFLGAFTNSYKWAHLDIAGVAWGDGAKAYQGRGGTGAGVRILAEFLNRWKVPRSKGPKPGRRTSLRQTEADKNGK